eukprot:GHVP01005813.1.p2 GENE.GHVP01005813.1~~GHVP01005813.1.p2  ORF type:complete len:105 (+),score=26.76 GHVP01005813.1:824-1138(+)
MGGQIDFFRFFVAEDLLCGHCCSTDSSFEAGNLLTGVLEEGLTKTNIDIETLEIWGLGGAEADEKFAQIRQRNEQHRNERRQVDKAKLAENEFDREHLLSNTFK